MAIDFTDIAYLKTGNDRQKMAFLILTKLKVLEKLKAYQPILTGTIPIGIDLPESDLDIICECKNHKEFSNTLIALFSDKDNFAIKTKSLNGIVVTIAKFLTESFEIEIFGQDCPTSHQNAYKHMLVEHKILNAKGDTFKKNILKLKKQGLKTEPAFAKLLGLKGDPYKALLNLDV